jgi:seryl-tRNA(Sec) selenium transferase
MLVRRLDRVGCGLYVSRMANAKKKRKAVMLGVGLDSDGHKRITQGANFALVGGTAETHEQMTEKAIKINEKLKARGKQLETVSHEEFDDIAQEVGLKKLPPQKPAR